MENKISKEKLIEVYHVEIQFFDELEEYGLLSVFSENNTQYILYDQLPVFERFANWYYDLQVNMAGIEVLHNLMDKLATLQTENQVLKHQLYLKSHHLDVD